MKPKLEKFREAAEKCGGNITKIAKAFNRTRGQVYEWMRKDAEFKAVIDDSRGSMVDDCISIAHILAKGIPDIQDGKMVGWIERPDASMVRFILSTQGRKEGFGENLDVTTNGKDINGVDLFRVLTKEEISNFDEEFEENY